MARTGFRFGPFLLDPAGRRLLRGDAPVELNARYFDALALLVREPGALVTKDRFLDEVWRGVPVTDEALTQCIRSLRRQLGDDAARPTYIETVPKYGYRFIAPVEPLDGDAPDPIAPEAAPLPARRDWRSALLLGAAGTVGGGVAGLVGGLFYGFVGASQPLEPGMGAASVLLVFLCLAILVALVGAAGVAFGIAAAHLFAGRFGPWSIAGGAAGGLVVGAVMKLLGLDAFVLLLGRSPGDITGAPEGVLIGAAIGLAAWLGTRVSGRRGLRRSIAIAALAGATAGILVALAGGRMLGGSLDLLARSFPESRLRLDPIASLFGETGFGPVTSLATAALEGMLFAACLVGAMILAERQMRGAFEPPLGTGEGLRSVA